MQHDGHLGALPGLDRHLPKRLEIGKRVDDRGLDLAVDSARANRGPPRDALGKGPNRRPRQQHPAAVMWIENDQVPALLYRGKRGAICARRDLAGIRLPPGHGLDGGEHGKHAPAVGGFEGDDAGGRLVICRQSAPARDPTIPVGHHRNEDSRATERVDDLIETGFTAQVRRECRYQGWVCHAVVPGER